MNWCWNEFRQRGRNYGDASEVDRYDQTHADFRDTEAEAKTVLEMLDAGNNTKLLDIGCGTGTFAIAAAQRCSEVIGIDVSEAMLAEAHRKASSLNLTNVRFEHHGFLTYQHAGQQLDAVTTTFALHHLPDYWQAAALRRIHTMLTPGGRLLLCDVVIPEGPDPQEAIQAFIDGQARTGGDFLRRDAEGHFREEFSTFDWVIARMLASAGFTILQRQIKSHVIATYLCQK